MSDPLAGDPEAERRQKLFDELAAEARADQQASSDSFDNNLLTYSSAILGLSLAFIKDIVPLNVAVWLPCLYASWGLLALCILATIASFRFGIEAQKKQQDFLHEYYINCKSEYFNKKSKWSVAVTLCAYIGAGTFFLAVVLTVFFSIRNVSYARNYAQGRHSEAVKNSSASAGQNGVSAKSAAQAPGDSTTTKPEGKK